MKFVTWNCQGALRKKIRSLDEFDADILLIQECENPAKFFQENIAWDRKFLWRGHNQNKGIGIFVKPNIDIKLLEWHDFDNQLFLPCRINDCFNLINVWTKRDLSRDFSYIGQMWRYLQIYKPVLFLEPSIICGDFNSNKIWDEKRVYWNHTNVVREFSELNMYSLYHKYKNEAHGEETEPTFHLHKNIGKPYHIDYAFISDSLLSDKSDLDIAKDDLWKIYSDHRPIIFTI